MHALRIGAWMPGHYCMRSCIGVHYLRMRVTAHLCAMVKPGFIRHIGQACMPAHDLEHGQQTLVSNVIQAWRK